MSEALRGTVLVTGGAGFIGSHVCDALIAQGFDIRCFDDLSTGHRGNIAHLEGTEGFTFIQGDIRSAEAMALAVKGASAIVHLAALGSVPRSIAQPLESHAVNVGGFLNMLESARAEGPVRIVYASSSSVYGDQPDLPKREGREGAPLSPYALTKQTDEAYAQVYHRLFGLSIIGLRFFNIFGERQDPEGAYAAAIPKFIRAMLKHQAPTLHGDGTQTRDFTYVGNAVQAVVQALKAPDERAGEVFNIAYGERCDLLHLAQKLRDRLAKIDPAIAGIALKHGPVRTGDVRDSWADVSKARKDLGYAPQFSLDQGLDRTVPWFAAHWK